MKVLFVCKGFLNKGNIYLPIPVIKNQADSLREKSIEVEFFLVKGNGVPGYLKNLGAIRHKIRNGKYDIVHAHYSLSGILVSLTMAKIPLIVSLMGGDVYQSSMQNFLVRRLATFDWDFVIAKSKNIVDRSGVKNCEIIPNGVNTSVFRPVPKEVAAKKLGKDPVKTYLLFASSPSRREKNFQLLESSLRLLRDENPELLIAEDISNDMMPYLYGLADVLTFTSLREGSPNVVKEAMACNCPIVSTDVGDVKLLLEGVDGCYISSFEPSGFAKKIKLAINFGRNTNGRKKLMEMGLDSDTVASKIVSVYEKVLEKRIHL